ncbi:hypothetical protein BpHYR1_039779 [Brachionus plicatilis]|uniref:Uncharacterized protein n=1 Tax=Brachionus plicatilis TaxID=10195 RepID=A0A3M7Q5Y9_BRAPC|nr:hypothetical protein BpHYR1_039779 [Brachionus plicatilis]
MDNNKKFQIISNKIISNKFFFGLPLSLFSGASTFLLISLLVDACTTFPASLSIVFLFFFVGITVSCGVSSSTSVIFRFRTLIELTTLSSLSACDWYSSAFLVLHGLPLLGFCPIITCLASIEGRKGTTSCLHPVIGVTIRRVIQAYFYRLDLIIN